MTSLKLLSLLLLFSLITSKKFTYQTSLFSESLELHENNKFKYRAKIHMSAEILVEGVYFIKNDSLYLNSIPQRDKLIVSEQFNSKHKRKNYFTITRKDSSLMTYHLYITLESGKQLVFKDQFESTIIPRERIKSFYIYDTMGLKSPSYEIKGLNTNSFNIIFETKRVFENESWVIKVDSIQPRGLDGLFQNYFLNM